MRPRADMIWVGVRQTHSLSFERVEECVELTHIGQVLLQIKVHCVNSAVLIAEGVECNLVMLYDEVKDDSKHSLARRKGDDA